MSFLTDGLLLIFSRNVYLSLVLTDPIFCVVIFKGEPSFIFVANETNCLSSIYADETQPISTSSNGWYYSNANNDSSKINWYIYTNTTAGINVSLSETAYWYAVINQTLDQSLPYIVIYTQADSITPNAEWWYKSKQLYVNQQVDSSTLTGLTLLWASNLSNPSFPSSIHPEISSRVQLSYNSQYSEGSQSSSELIFEHAFSTNKYDTTPSNFTFTLSEYGVIYTSGIAF